MRSGCLLCVICDSNSFHSFIFKLCIMIVHTLKMCTLYFVYEVLFFFGVLSLDTFRYKMLRWCLVCVICNSNSFHFFMKVCIMSFYTLKMSTFYFVQISRFFLKHFLGLELRHFFCKVLRGCLVCVIRNSNSFHSLIFKYTCSYIEHVHLTFCAHLIKLYIFLFLELLSLDIIRLKCFGCVLFLYYFMHI